MTNVKKRREGPSKGGDLTGRERPMIPLNAQGRRWWRWLIKAVDHDYVGKADLPAMALLAAALGDAQKLADGGGVTTGVALKRLLGLLSEFGLVPDGRRRLVQLSEVVSSGGARKPSGYEEFD